MRKTNIHEASDALAQLTEFQRKTLVGFTHHPRGIDTPPGGYRTAGQDASRWWRAVDRLRGAGLVRRVSGPTGGYGAHEITDEGRDVAKLLPGYGPEPKPLPKLVLDMNDPRGIVNVDKPSEKGTATVLYMPGEREQQEATREVLDKIVKALGGDVSVSAKVVDGQVTFSGSVSMKVPS